jgi:hypothetical protein
MITKVITTLYDGLAPIHEKYIKQVQDSGQDLKIIYGRSEMIIKSKDIKNKIVRWTGGNRDKWNGEHYSIAYYAWSPIIKGRAKKVAEKWDKWNKMTPQEQFYKLN